jgi:conjugal transfer pilus assembly protein TrbC
MPSDAELSRVPVPTMPKVDALPQPLANRRIDLGAIARGYEAMDPAASGAAPLAGGPALLVFVTFAMPEAALERLIDQAARTGAAVLLRGLVDGSLQKTVLRAQRLIGQRQIGVQIDPQAFDRFSVSSAPTFVLLKGGAAPSPCAAGTCYPPSAYVAVAGDVSLDYALEFIRRSTPAFDREATSYLSKLKGAGR